MALGLFSVNRATALGLKDKEVTVGRGTLLMSQYPCSTYKPTLRDLS